MDRMDTMDVMDTDRCAACTAMSDVIVKVELFNKHMQIIGRKMEVESCRECLNDGTFDKWLAAQTIGKPAP